MKLRDWFLDQSIQHKLSGVMVVVILAAMLPIVSVTLGYEYYAVRLASLKEAQVQADIIRDNVAAALAFRDTAAATEVLDSLRASPTIFRAVLLTPDRSLFAQYQRNGTVSSTDSLASLAEGETIAGKSLGVVRRVDLKRQAVGWLIVESSLDAFYTRIQWLALVSLLSTFAGLALALLLAQRLIERITGPLSRLVALTHHVVNKEDYTLRETVESQDEIGSLSQAFNTMLSHIHERDVRLNQLAYYDNVTRLANRHYFKERAEQVVGNSLRYGGRSCLMFIDLDRFKAVNDTLGHDKGDDLLRAVAQRLTQTLRNNDVVCRIGGDEFAVILENVKNLNDVALLAQKMINALAKPFALDGHEVLIGGSIGISACPDHAHTMAELLRCADIAMYQAKSLGRGQFCIYRADFEATQL